MSLHRKSNCRSSHQIAFKEAIDKYNIKRVFTFHKSINTAKSFTENSSEGIHTHLPEFNTFHVNGTMSIATREGVMNEFQNSDYSVISNARCLTEGVDLPAVDMVAFMSPKKSKVDIVQATGRAMRKDPNNPDKIYGYILVPLCLEIVAGESIEDAVAKADFGEVWNVLQALQEQDEILADIIRQIQEDKGRHRKHKGDDFGDKVETLGVSISLNTLQESITAVCIDKLGFTWDFRYGELIKYKEQFGDCNVPHIYRENMQLANWVNIQRRYYRIEELSEDCIKRLDEIGFEWNISESNWEKMFEALDEYEKQHGNCNVPIDWPENQQLANWIGTQRTNYSKRKLSKEKLKRLEEIGFKWPSRRYQPEINSAEYWRWKWEWMFEALEVYMNKYGDCNVPSRWPENQALASWTGKQREKYRSKKLGKEKFKRLEEIGFEWGPPAKQWPFKQRDEIKWTEYLNALQEYRNKYGDCNVPANWTDRKLANWVAKQRKNYRNGKLSEDRLNDLEDIGFVWDLLKSNWKQMFDALKEYKEKNEKCNVPSGWTENKPLANWVVHQRVNYRNGNLSEDRIRCLEAIGFEWNIHK